MAGPAVEMEKAAFVLSMFFMVDSMRTTSPAFTKLLMHCAFAGSESGRDTCSSACGTAKKSKRTMN